MNKQEKGIMYKKIISCVVGLSTLAAVGLVNAAIVPIVSLTPSPQTISVGDTFNITAHGTGFDSDVSVLDMTLTWDTNFLQLNTTDITISDDATALGFDVSLSSFVALIDSSTPGTLNLTFDTPFMSSVLTTPSGIFDFFTLEFEAINPTGLTAIMATNGIAGGWGDGFLTPFTPEYVGADITVSAVPVPAAVWLFGSGLLGLVGVARRSTKTTITA